MIKKSLVVALLMIISSLVFSFSYSQTSTTATTSTSTTQNEAVGDVYTRNTETYKYISSFDGSEGEKTFDNQNTRDVGTVFNYLLTIMAVAIVILVIYRLLAGAVIKGTFDNIYDQMKGRKYIKTAGTALIIFIFAYAILSFINPDLTGWTVATDFIGKKRIDGLTSSGGMCTGNTLAGKNVEQLIREHEGFIACPYKDSKQIATIGIGYNLTNSTAREDLKNAGVSNIDAIMNYPAGGKTCPASAPKITEAQAIKLLENYLPKARAAAVEFAGGESEFKSHPEDMQKILIDMSYNMGSIKFPDMQAALKKHDYVNVAKEMVDSDWYTQVGNRAKELVKVVEGFTCKTSNSDSLGSQAQQNSADRCNTILSIKESDLVDVRTLGIKCTQGTCLLKEDSAKNLKILDDRYYQKFAKHIEVRSAYRSDAQQAATCASVSGQCARACSQGGNGSNHSLGDAVDLSNETIGGCNKAGNCTTEEYKWLKTNSDIGFTNTFDSLPVDKRDNVHFSKSGR